MQMLMSVQCQTVDALMSVSIQWVATTVCVRQDTPSLLMDTHAKVGMYMDNLPVILRLTPRDD